MSALSQFAAEQGIRYFLVAFTDLAGVLRAKLVPAGAISEAEEGGAGFAGFAACFDLSAAHPDIIARPDPSGTVRLPWKPEVAWVPADLYLDGEPFEQSPRNVLRRLVRGAGQRGLQLMTGVEPEFFLLSPDGADVADSADRQSKPCYDQVTIMRNYEIIRTIFDAIETLGWEPYQCDHEDGSGQYELNWKYSSSLQTADRHSFFKFMVRTIAERHGMRATFMPKPFEELTGSGCHVHASAWREGRNIFLDPTDRLGLSDTCYEFIKLLLRYASPMALLTNPTVNSYKRLNARSTTSGATWAPTELNWGGNDRTKTVRVPAPGRVEYRLGDGSANPYLLQSALLACLLELDDQAAHLPSEDGSRQAQTLSFPRNLLDAIRAFERSDVLRKYCGGAFVEAYAKIKTAEWDCFHSHLSTWERTALIDC
ncbi:MULTISPECIES: type III glutamate--ammonia ligase [unclassified Bradyrhizobium]|uniref:type III glutamate--ammonia ligase n=1 Tax=unclassified Bradyrhizobium TaxID=2631580 RepID=UPI00291677FC|nr:MULTISPECIES: type III glutamate--ammonia ligase [unclassified Bradyrhizobium]